MGLKKLFILLILVIFVINVWGNLNQTDNYGKLEGWVVDPKTGEPVNEVFEIMFFECKIERPIPRYLKFRKTDNRGYISVELEPRSYCLHFQPASKESKYCDEPLFQLNPDFNFPVLIEQGKITKFKKKATLGGAIKIRLLDVSGRLIDPLTELPGDVDVSFETKAYSFEQYRSEELDKSERIFKSLFPAIYKIQVSFRKSGYKTLTFKDIAVKENDVVSIDCMIDINDKTGIEGYVVDINGNPAKYLTVIMLPKNHNQGRFSILTNEKGYFKISGLTEGIYIIGVSSLKHGCRFYDEIIYIKKGILFQKNIQLDRVE